MKAILELRAIAKQWPGMEKQIDEWISRNVKEMAIEVSMDKLSVQDEAHRAYNIEKAQRELGTMIAKFYNPKPDFWKIKSGPAFICMMRAHVLEAK